MKYLQYLGIVGLVGLIGLLSLKSNNLGFINNPSGGAAPVSISEKITQTSVPAGNNLFTNPGFESGNFTGWTTSSIGGLDYSVTTTAAAGTYAGQMALTADSLPGGSPAGILEQRATITPGQLMEVQFAIRAATNTSADAAVSLVFSDGTIGNNTYSKLWNWSLKQWVNTTTIDQYTSGNFSIGDPLSTSTFYFFAPTSSVFDLTSPEGSGLGLALAIFGRNGDVIIVDDFKVRTAATVTTNQFQTTLFQTASDISLATTSTTACDWKFTAGTSTCIRWHDALGNEYINRGGVCIKTDPFTQVTSTATCI